MKYAVICCAALIGLLAGSDVLWGQAERFKPQAACMDYDPILINGVVVTDFLIFASYVAIPALMLIATSLRQDLFRSWRWLVVLYAAFIFTCGLSHLIDAVVIVSPRYFILFLSQAVCAVFSVATLVALLTYYREVLEKVPNVDDLTKQIDELEGVLQSREATVEALRRLHASMERLSGANSNK